MNTGLNITCILVNNTASSNTSSAGSAAATGSSKGKGKGKGKKKDHKGVHLECAGLNRTAEAGDHKNGKGKDVPGESAAKAKGHATKTIDSAADATATVSHFLPPSSLSQC